MPAWPFYTLTRPSVAPAQEAEALIAEYLDVLAPADVATFHADAKALCDALHLAVLGTDPHKSGPWLWAYATGLLAACFRKNLTTLVAEMDAAMDRNDVAPVALEDCDA